MGDTIHNFFTSTSVGTFVGATAIISVLSNTIRMLTGRNPLFLLFLICLGVAYFGAYVGHALTDVVNAVLTFINGCLLFCTTAGAQEAGIALRQRAQRTGGAELQAQEPVRFLSSWFE